MPVFMFSQSELKGVILEANENNEEIPLPGANVYWLNTSVGASTDIDGMFTIPYNKDYKKLVISYVGFKTDTLEITNNKMVKHWLEPVANLDEVTIKGKRKASATSYLESQNIINISSEELLKSCML